MATGAQEMVVGRPGRAVGGLVRRYEGFRYSGLEPGTHQGLPSGNLAFIVSLDEPIAITAMPGLQSPGSFHAFVGGLHVKPATVAHAGSGAGISIKLSPFASQALFGVPAAALASCVVDLADLVGSRAAELVDRMSETSAWGARFAVLDDVLSAVLSDGPDPSPEVVRAWRLLVASAGGMPTGQLARDVGYSRRHLTQRFSAELGISPKAASRVLRFEHTCSLLDAGFGLAEAAARGGYYDQAHLTNEWKDLAGTNPTAWKGDELRDRSLDERRAMAHDVA